MSLAAPDLASARRPNAPDAPPTVLDWRCVLAVHARDAFFAMGSIGQHVVIMPSEKLVLVRLGRSPNWPGDGVFGSSPTRSWRPARAKPAEAVDQAGGY